MRNAFIGLAGRIPAVQRALGDAAVRAGLPLTRLARWCEPGTMRPDRTRTYPHGVPSWVDTVAHDLDEAKRFYTGLFDWTFDDAMPAEAPGNYLIATIDGQDVAAIGSPDDGPEGVVAHLHRRRRRRRHRQAGRGRRAAPSRWRPSTPGPGGRRAVCVDPRGAEFSLWQARKRPGAQLVNAPGAWNFSDLLTTDPHEAAKFYSALFGWEIDDVGLRDADPQARLRRSPRDAPSTPTSGSAKPRSSRRPDSKTPSRG